MMFLVPMAGDGVRFKKQGYKLHKPVIPTTDWRTGKKVPMVVAAVQDLPGFTKDSDVIFIDRDFHKESGVEKELLKHFKNAKFVTLAQLSEGQASSCLTAEELLRSEEELVVGGCDNGMIIDQQKFNEERNKADVLILTFRKDPAVTNNPNAYGWVRVDQDNNVLEVSVKKAISNDPMNDHAIVSSFWFKKAEYLLNSSKKMISENDRINNEFYLDQAMNHCLALGYKVRVLEVDRYICWGTPVDYENYEATLAYWKNFHSEVKL